jgi:hypothetical protein
MNELEVLRQQVEELKRINNKQAKTIQKYIREILEVKQETQNKSQWVELDDKNI